MTFRAVHTFEPILVTRTSSGRTLFMVSDHSVRTSCDLQDLPFEGEDREVWNVPNINA
jgi:hypothetical protein